MSASDWVRWAKQCRAAASAWREQGKAEPRLSSYYESRAARAEERAVQYEDKIASLTSEEIRALSGTTVSRTGKRGKK